MSLLLRLTAEYLLSLLLRLTVVCLPSKDYGYDMLNYHTAIQAPPAALEATVTAPMMVLLVATPLLAPLPLAQATSSTPTA